MAKDWLHRKAKEYAHNHIHEWEEHNPRPPAPIAHPESVPNHYLTTPKGFIALEPTGGANLRLHIVQEGQHHAQSKMNLSELRHLIEMLLDIEAGLREIQDWKSSNTQIHENYQRWHGQRASAIETLMKEYLDSKLSDNHHPEPESATG